MMAKVELQTVDIIGSNPEPTLDPFAPENLRLNQSFTELVGVKKILTTVPVRKPGAQDFVRVRPGADYRENFPVIDLKDDREEYIVTASLVPELLGEIVNKTLFLAINKQGTVFFWPVRLPSPDGKDLDWWRSAREAAERATRTWVRVKANMNLGAYDVYEAQATLSEPEWPELGYWDLVRLAFRDHLITDLDHAVIKRLRGLA
jgi:hypothetical protein